MVRLIDGDALKEYIDCGHLRNPCEVCLSELDVVNLIDEAPTVDAEPARHGKWKSHGDCGVTECSCCGWNIEECVGWNYCPNCGADMRGESDD